MTRHTNFRAYANGQQFYYSNTRAPMSHGGYMDTGYSELYVNLRPEALYALYRGRYYRVLEYTYSHGYELPSAPDGCFYVIRLRSGELRALPSNKAVLTPPRMTLENEGSPIDVLFRDNRIAHMECR